MRPDRPTVREGWCGWGRLYAKCEHVLFLVASRRPFLTVGLHVRHRDQEGDEVLKRLKEKKA